MTKTKEVAEHKTDAPATLSNSNINRMEFTDQQLDLIKRKIAVGATNDELALFINQAKRTGLDPMSRQIYFIKRGDRPVIQVSIDGLRIVAERSGDYAGQDEPEFVYEGTSKTPLCAKVKVYKWHGSERYLAATGVAFMSEYKPVAGADSMWVKMPHTMLSKVAEALALRKSFPQDLSGLYTGDEMAQAENPAPEAEPVKQVNTEEAKQILDAPVEETEKAEIYCSVAGCNEKITKSAAEFTMHNYGKILCFKHAEDR